MSKLHHARGGAGCTGQGAHGAPHPCGLTTPFRRRGTFISGHCSQCLGEPWITEQTTLSVPSCPIHLHAGSSQKTHRSMTSMSVRWPRKRQGHRWATWRANTWSCQPSSSRHKQQTQPPEAEGSFLANQAALKKWLADGHALRTPAYSLKSLSEGSLVSPGHGGRSDSGHLRSSAVLPHPLPSAICGTPHWECLLPPSLSSLLTTRGGVLP